MARGLDGLRRPFGGALLALALTAGSAGARPITLSDIQHLESFGQAETDPRGRWLVFERRIGAAESFRFDYDGHDELVRTRLWRVDLRRPGAARPLFPPARRAGYALGPFSPDGRRIAVFRLTDRAWELGVATLATGHVRWLRITPELETATQTLAWTSPTQLLVLARPFGDLPFELRYTRVAQLELPQRWRATAMGKRSVTVVGSGRFLGLRPHEAPRRLMRVDVASGRRAVLATGAFVHLAPSPDGRRVALIENGDDAVMDAARRVQGEYGFENTHRRLVLLDGRKGGLTRPCAGCDVLVHPLSWSPDGTELLAYARRDGQAWAEGQLLRLDAARGVATPAGDGIAPSLVMRPEAVRAAWFAGAPIVWGTPKGTREATPRWFRLAGGAPVPLGPDLRAESDEGLVVDSDHLLLAADGDVWRISPDGTARRAASDVRPMAEGQVIRGMQYQYDPPTGDHLLALRAERAGERLVSVSETGVRTLARLPARGEILGAGPDGVLVRSFAAGPEQRLDWLPTGGPAVRVATINAALADVGRPEVRAVRHAGPHGEALTSWLILPPPRPGPPPPLIVRPYLGSRMAMGPEKATPGHELMDDAALLLAAHGYAVLLPSLPKTLEAPGVTAGLAERVLAIVDLAAADPALGRRFDPHRLGLWGVSFGGFSTLAIVTQTDRFRAAIAQASMSDLFSMWGQFFTADRVDPTHGLSTFYSAGWVEDVQPSTGAPPWSDPQRYLFDSPAMHADRVKTPLMLIHGELDSFSSGQAEEMFSGLLRQNKDAVLAIYWGENHNIRSPQNQRDLYTRAFAWLDEHLRRDVNSASGPRADGPAPAPASGGRTPPPPQRTE